MKIAINDAQLSDLGLDAQAVDQLRKMLNALTATTPEQGWQTLSSLLSAYRFPFSVHLYLFTLLFPDWREQPDTGPAYSHENSHR